MQGVARRTLAYLLVFGFVFGCAPQVSTLAPARPPLAAPSLRAGANAVEITPPPGFSLGGHSVESGTAIGTWTPLMVRAIYFEDDEGEPLVLAIADLWAIPAGLGDAVAERLRAHAGLEHVAREHIILAATHTHHGPGNYSSSRLYNAFASGALGFDPRLHAHLRDKIALAIVGAAASAQPAVVYWSSEQLGGQARNRNPLPFARNEGAAALVNANAGLPGCARANEPLDRCRALDPTLHVLRVVAAEARQDDPIALVGVWAAHSTALENKTDLFHGDVPGIAALHAESRLSRGATTPVVAIFNGPEGDVSPHWETQRPAEAHRLGVRLGERLVAHASMPGQKLKGPIVNRFERIPIADAEAKGGRTARRALPGRALLGGAEDGRTRYHRRIPPGQRVTRERRRGQGTKRPAVPPALFALGFPGDSVPREVPVSVHGIGPLRFVGLPGEFTTMAGRAVKHALAEVDSRAGPIIPIGLANEYLSYFTTRAEYELQHYEGGSTLYGPASTEVVAQGVARLATRTHERARSDRVRRYRTGAHRSFGLVSPTRRARKLVRRRAPGVRELLDSEAPHRVQMRFSDGAPSWRVGGTRPRAHIEVETQAGWVPFERQGREVNDHGHEFVTWLESTAAQGWTWTVAWLGVHPTSTRQSPRLRLRVRGVEGEHYCSPPFSESGWEGVLALAARDCQ